MATLAVRGVGVVPGAPDEGVVTIELTATRATESEAYDEVAERNRALVDVYKRLDLSEARRTGVTVRERTEYDDEGRPRHLGYSAVAVAEVRVTDPETASRLLREAVDVGGRVQGPRWRIAPHNPARLEACSRAAQDARRRAEAYAGALDLRLGALLEAGEPGVSTSAGQRAVNLQPMLRSAVVGGLTGETAMIDVEPGQFDVVAQLDVTFALEPR